jgi:hypothetical protein
MKLEMDKIVHENGDIICWIQKLFMELLNFKTKTIQLPLPNRVVSIGQDVLWNVNKHRICKLSTTDCFSVNIWLWLLSQNGSSKMAPFWHLHMYT